jgi:phospholipase C
MIKRIGTISFYRTVTLLALLACNFSSLHLSAQKQEEDEKKVAQFKKKIKHIVVIYEENWSFDGLFGDFPGANNITQAKNTTQVDRKGTVLTSAPQPYASTYVNPPLLDTSFNGITLPAAPYDLLKYIKDPSRETGDLRHLFYSEQLQIDNGKMDKFILYSDNGGLTMSYINLHDQRRLLDTLEWKLASQYTLCDNFFHSAFGGSFLNHIWFVAAASPEWNNAPRELISQPDPDKPNWRDAQLTPDGYVVNTSFSVNTPHPAKASPGTLMPYQKMPTIGDRLIDGHVSWAWYSGGWDRTVASKGANDTFQYHHQPLLYFETFRDSSENKKKYIKDEKHFFEALASDTFPSVSFIKPYGSDNEHPGYSDLWTGMVHAQKLVDSIMHSKYWGETVIIITSDENGGRWDHVAPPKIDRWGPGSRIPAVIISPYAKKGFIDHTQYETVSILKFIETRFDLKPLTNRDAQANDLLNAFDFK